MTWLEVVFVAVNTLKKCQIIHLKLNSEEHEAIKINQQLSLDHQAQRDIAEICAKYCVVRNSVERNLSLAELLNIVDTSKAASDKLNEDEIGHAVSDKFNRALKKNPDLPKMCTTNKSYMLQSIWHICKYYSFRRRTVIL